MKTDPAETFGADIAPANTEVVVAEYSKQDIEIQVATAKRYPRSLTQFKRKAIEYATYDLETAISCLYSVPRGGKNIEGESIRLAEIVASCYGNILFGAVKTGEDARSITISGWAWDLENNVRVAIPTVGRITNKNNERYNDDMILTAEKATRSKAMRDAIFKVVPKSLVKEIVNQAKLVIAGDTKTIGERRDKALAIFKDNWEIEASTVYEFLDVKGREDITGEHLQTLLGFHNALNEADLGERNNLIASMKKPLAETVAPEKSTVKVK